MADLALDAVVSRPLPHRHELTHLLVNFAEKHIPLYTMPFLQEGTASYFGGRWGRSPRTIMYTGAALIRNNITDLDDILTYADFHGVVGTPDVSYPLSAILTDRLLARMDPQQFLDLYRALSGPLTYVRAFTKEDIMAMLGKYSGVSWNVLADDCRRLADGMKTCGIDPLPAVPGEKPLRTMKSAANGILVNIWKTDEFFQFQIIASDTTHAGLLLISNDSKAPSAYVSRLFSQHAPGEVYHGEPFGIKFTEAEVSCYNYLCDELTGIYVPGFAGTIESPAPDLWDASAQTYRFTIEKSLFPSTDPSKWQLRIVSF